MPQTNPWVVAAPPAPAPPAAPTPPSPTPLGGPARPQPGAVPPPTAGRLPVRPVPADATGHSPGWWWVGCHGGAGVSTLATALPGGRAAGQAWPDSPAGARVVLVARTHAAGLQAAQHAAAHWASGTLPPGIDLLGLVAVADAPGRLPTPLRELLDLVEGGLPRVWQLPWVEALRLGDPPQHAALPCAYRLLAADLARLAPSLGDARA